MRSVIENERKALEIYVRSQRPPSLVHSESIGTATMMYAAGVIGVLIYAYFEPQDQQ